MAQEFLPWPSRPGRSPPRRFWRGYRVGSPGQLWLAMWATLRRAGEGPRPFGLRSQSTMIKGTVLTAGTLTVCGTVTLTMRGRT
jgi:hypothetical protein